MTRWSPGSHAHCSAIKFPTWMYRVHKYQTSINALTENKLDDMKKKSLFPKDSMSFLNIWSPGDYNIDVRAKRQSHMSVTQFGYHFWKNSGIVFLLLNTSAVLTSRQQVTSAVPLQAGWTFPKHPSPSQFSIYVHGPRRFSIIKQSDVAHVEPGEEYCRNFHAHH